MKYVYILECIAEPDRHYTGVTDDLKARLAKHILKATKKRSTMLRSQ